LQRNGDQVLIVPLMAASDYKGARVYGVSGFPVAAVSGLKLALPDRIGHALEEFQPDIIHVVNRFGIGWAVFRC